MKKKILLSMLLSAFMLGSSLTAYAAPQTMADGTVFDAEYYAQNNPDVIAALGNDANMMYQHYVKYGKAEGRKAYDDAATVAIPQAASGIKIEPGDENYLRAGYLSVGYNYGGTDAFSLSCDPAIGFERKDWSANPFYQRTKNEILAIIAAGIPEHGYHGESPFYYWDSEYPDADAILDNLSIDLVKEGTLKRCYILTNPEIRREHPNYHQRFAIYNLNCDSDYSLSKHPEIVPYFN